MLPKGTMPPKGKRIQSFKDVEDWIEAWNAYFERVYQQILSEFTESDRFIVKGDDHQQVHGFFTNKSDMKVGD